MVRFIFRCESEADAARWKKYLERATSGNRDASIHVTWESGLDKFPGVVMDVEARFTLEDDAPTELCIYRTIDVHHLEIENLPPIAE